MKKWKKPVKHNLLLTLFILVQVTFIIAKSLGIVTWSWIVIGIPSFVVIGCGVIAVILVIVFWEKIIKDDEGNNYESR